MQTEETDATAGSLLDNAKRKLGEGDAAAAEALARRALSAEPDDHHAMEVLARALLSQNRAKEALTFIDVMVKKRSKRAAYRILEGDAWSQLGDRDAALRAWRAAQTLEPTNRELVQRLGVNSSAAQILTPSRAWHQHPGMRTLAFVLLVGFSLSGCFLNNASPTRKSATRCTT